MILSFSEAPSAVAQLRIAGGSWQQAQFAIAAHALTTCFSPAWQYSFSPRFFLDSRVPNYLAGVFRAPLPNLLVHIHGAVFSLWILLLIAQTSFIARGRVDVHRRMGLFGFGLACLMVILGLMTATDSRSKAICAT